MREIKLTVVTDGVRESDGDALTHALCDGDERVEAELHEVAERDLESDEQDETLAQALEQVERLKEAL